jgi:hypothetical protein
MMPAFPIVAIKSFRLKLIDPRKLPLRNQILLAQVAKRIWEQGRRKALEEHRDATGAPLPKEYAIPKGLNQKGKTRGILQEVSGKLKWFENYESYKVFLGASSVPDGRLSGAMWSSPSIKIRPGTNGRGVCEVSFKGGLSMPKGKTQSGKARKVPAAAKAASIAEAWGVQLMGFSAELKKELAELVLEDSMGALLAHTVTITHRMKG